MGESTMPITLCTSFIHRRACGQHDTKVRKILCHTSSTCITNPMHKGDMITSTKGSLASSISSFED